MPIFTYKAKRGPRKIVEGSIEAENQLAAIDKLAKEGLFPISVFEQGAETLDQKKPSPLSFLKKVKTRDIGFFTRQLADLLESGLTLLKALDLLKTQTENKILCDVIRDLYDKVKDGAEFSASLSQHPNVFSNLYVSMIKSGEVSGNLEGILKELAFYAEREDEIRSKIRSSMAYPILILCVGVLTIFILMTLVVPRLVELFEDLGQVLPLPTRILIWTSHMMATYWWLAAAIIVLFVFVVQRKRKTGEGKRAIDAFQLRIPIVGDFFLKGNIVRISQTLGTLLKNGVPILRSLRVTADTVSNQVLKEEIEKFCENVAEGKTLGDSINQSEYFPDFVSNMIAVGEQGGNIENSLLKVAEAYSREVDRTVRLMTTLLEPIMILVMAIVVGFIVVSMLMPIFQINVMVR